jgi:hypothetical protein
MPNTSLTQIRIKQIVLIVFSLLFAFSIVMVLFALFMDHHCENVGCIVYLYYAVFVIPIVTIFFSIPLYYVLEKDDRWAMVVSIIGALCLFYTIYRLS